MAARKAANASVPIAGAAPWSSITATLIQSLPAPSEKAKANTNTPISSVRGSRQAVSESRVALEALGSSRSGRKRWTSNGTHAATATPTTSRWGVTPIVERHHRRADERARRRCRG